MKKLLATTAIGIAMAATPAMAGPDTDVSQTLTETQDALNLNDIGGDLNSSSQSASNTANVLDWIDGTDGDFDDISQVVDGGGDDIDIQRAINRVLVDDEIFGPGNEQKVSDFTQDATNNANYVNIDDVEAGGSAVQKFESGQDNQVARNFIGGDNDASGFGDGGTPSDNELEFDDVEQSAANFANTIVADDFKGGTNDFLQDLADSTDQTATNAAHFELRAEAVDQSAVNSANSADVNGIDTTVEQSTGDRTDQVARNDLLREDADNDGTGSVVASTQEATNIANVLTSQIETGTDAPDQDQNSNETPAPEVNRVDQYAGDTQRASNDVSFGDKLGVDNGKGWKPDVEQSASNVMNLAQVEAFEADGNDLESGANGTLVNQLAAGASADSIQVARNTAWHEGGGSLGEPVEAGNVTDVEQSASNAANIAYVGSLPSYSGVQEFDQTASVPQLSTNSLTTPGSVTDVAQGASNVANVVGQLDD